MPNHCTKLQKSRIIILICKTKSKEKQYKLDVLMFNCKASTRISNRWIIFNWFSSVSSNFRYFVSSFAGFHILWMVTIRNGCSFCDLNIDDLSLLTSYYLSKKIELDYSKVTIKISFNGLRSWRTLQGTPCRQILKVS